MKDKKRSTQKELKGPDEFETFWTRVVDFVVEHKRSLGLGLAGVVALILLAWAGLAYMDRRERTAAELLGRARIVLLPAGGAAQGASLPDGDGRSEEAAQEAVATLEEVVRDYGGTPAGLQSRLLLGQVYFDRGDHDAALEVYGDLAERGGAPPEMKALAWEGLAYVHEEMGEPAEAIPWYRKVTEETEAAYLHPWAWMGLGRSYEQIGQPQEALDAYWRFMSDFPNHPQVEEARASVSKLGSRLSVPPQGEPGAGKPATEAADPEKGGP